MQETYKALKFNEYSTCNHLVMITGGCRDNRNSKIEYRYGCIKCGLDDGANSLDSWADYARIPTSDDELMRGYLKGKTLERCTHLGCNCSMKFAHRIYQKIQDFKLTNDEIVDLFKNIYYIWSDIECDISSISDIKIDEVITIYNKEYQKQLVLR